MFAPVASAGATLRFSVAFNEPVFAGREALFRGGQQSGEFRGELDPRVMSISVQASIDGMFAYWVTYPDHDLEAHADELADLFIHAARTGRPGGRAGRAGFAAAAAAAVAIVLLIIGSGEEAAFLGHGTWQSLAITACESALAIGIVLGLLTLFRERLDGQGRRRRFLSAHAYTVYLIHPVVLVALGYALSGVAAPAVAKFALLAVLAVPLCWAAAFPIRALPGARKVL